MKRSKIHIPSLFRRFTDGSTEIEVNGVTIKEALDELFRKFPEIRDHIIDENGGIRNFINIYINQENIREQAGFDTLVIEGSEIHIIPSIAGGVDFTPLSLRETGSIAGIFRNGFKNWLKKMQPNG